MNEMVEIKNQITDFVAGLSDSEVREQLVLAYEQMELCRKVLKGEDVNPVEMKDNGLSSDLELFYSCKKTADELAYLNDAMRGADVTEESDMN